MNAASAPDQQPLPTPAGSPFTAPVRAWWRTLAARERQWLLAATLLLALALLWSLLIAPAWRTLQRAPADDARLDLQWADMQALAQEAAELRATPSITPEGAAAALQTAVARLGGRAQLALQADRAVIKLQGVSLHELGPWLQELRAGTRTRPLDLSLTRATAGYNGQLVLSRENRP